MIKKITTLLLRYKAWPLPIRILSLAIFSTVIVLSLLISFATYSLLTGLNNINRQQELIDYQGLIRYQSRILEFALHLYLESGAASWKERYKEWWPRQEQTISGAVRLAPRNHQLQLIFAVDTAFNHISLMEQNIFAAFEAGETATARLIITSGMYTDQQAIFNKELEKFAEIANPVTQLHQIAFELLSYDEIMRSTAALSLLDDNPVRLRQYDQAEQKQSELIQRAQLLALQPVHGKLIEEIKRLHTELVTRERTELGAFATDSGRQSASLINQQSYLALRRLFTGRIQQLLTVLQSETRSDTVSKRTTVVAALVVLGLLVCSLILTWFFVFRILDKWQEKLRLSRRRLKLLTLGLEKRVTATVELTRRQAVTDPLTGLPNLQQLIMDLLEHNYPTFAVLNIDNYSSFREAFGPDLVNILLVKIASRLQTCLPADCSLYKLSYDEFVITSCYLIRDKHFFLELNRQLNSPPLNIDGVELYISFGFGIVLHEKTNQLRKANSALMNAKRYGPGSALIYNQHYDRSGEFRKNIYWTRKVRNALEEHKLRLYYQGIFNNSTGQVEKYETLVRLQAGSRIITPNHFLEPATKAGLLPRITQWLLETVFDYFKDKPWDFSINIGTDDLLKSDLPGLIAANLKRTGINPARVIFEILETASLYHYEFSLEIINRIHKLGCKLAIDDFGTAYSHFSRIIDFKADFIKIDGGFIRKLNTCARSRAVAGAIVAFARDIGAEVVAEYVNNRQLFEIVKEMGIHYSQGYYLAKPLPAI